MLACIAEMAGGGLAAPAVGAVGVGPSEPLPFLRVRRKSCNFTGAVFPRAQQATT